MRSLASFISASNKRLQQAIQDLLRSNSCWLPCIPAAKETDLLTVSSSWNLSNPLTNTVLSAPGLGFGVKPAFSPLACKV